MGRQSGEIQWLTAPTVFLHRWCPNSRIGINTATCMSVALSLVELTSRTGCLISALSSRFGAAVLLRSISVRVSPKAGGKRSVNTSGRRRQANAILPSWGNRKMADGTKIEWTEATCPCYNTCHGTDERRRNQNSRQKSGGDSIRVSVTSRFWRKMVLQLSHMAPTLRIRQRRKSMGRLSSELPSVKKLKGETKLCIEAAPPSWPVICSCARWRRQTGAAPHQLFCRKRINASSERSSLHRLRPHMAGWGAAS